MRLITERYWMEIVAESDVDRAYIEEVLGLRDNLSEAIVRRQNVIGLDALASLVLVPAAKIKAKKA